jgi:hypothetical protein
MRRRERWWVERFRMKLLYLVSKKTGFIKECKLFFEKNLCYRYWFMFIVLRESLSSITALYHFFARLKY